MKRREFFAGLMDRSIEKIISGYLQITRKLSQPDLSEIDKIQLNAQLNDLKYYFHNPRGSGKHGGCG